MHLIFIHSHSYLISHLQNRYSGRTQQQVLDYVRTNIVRRQPFQRTTSFLRSASSNIHHQQQQQRSSASCSSLLHPQSIQAPPHFIDNPTSHGASSHRDAEYASNNRQIRSLSVQDYQSSNVRRDYDADDDEDDAQSDDGRQLKSYHDDVDQEVYDKLRMDANSSSKDADRQSSSAASKGLIKERRKHTDANKQNTDSITNTITNTNKSTNKHIDANIKSVDAGGGVKPLNANARNVCETESQSFDNPIESRNRLKVEGSGHRRSHHHHHHHHHRDAKARDADKRDELMMDENLLRKSSEFIDEVVQDAMKEISSLQTPIFQSDRNCNVKMRGNVDHDDDKIADAKIRDAEDDDENIHKVVDDGDKQKKKRDSRDKHRSKSQFTRALYSRADRFYERVHPRRDNILTPISQQILYVNVRSLPSLDAYSYRDDSVDKIDPIESLISNQIRSKEVNRRQRKLSSKKHSNETDLDDEIMNPKSEGSLNRHRNSEQNDGNLLNLDDSSFNLNASVELSVDKRDAPADEEEDEDDDYDEEYIALSRGRLNMISKQNSIKNRIQNRKIEAKKWLKSKLDAIKDEIIDCNLHVHAPDDVDVLIRDQIKEGKFSRKKKDSIKINYDISFDDIPKVNAKYNLSHPLFLYHLVIRMNLRQILLL